MHRLGLGRRAVLLAAMVPLLVGLAGCQANPCGREGDAEWIAPGIYEKVVVQNIGSFEVYEGHSRVENMSFKVARSWTGVGNAAEVSFTFQEDDRVHIRIGLREMTDAKARAVVRAAFGELGLDEVPPAGLHFEWDDENPCYAL